MFINVKQEMRWSDLKSLT